MKSDPEHGAPGAPDAKIVSRTTLAARKRARRSRVWGFLVTLSIVGFSGYFMHQVVTNYSTWSPPASKKLPSPSAGTITFASDGDTCRQVVIDNNAARLSDSKRVACNGKPSADARERMQERYSGRLETVRDSFNQRRPSDTP